GWAGAPLEAGGGGPAGKLVVATGAKQAVVASAAGQDVVAGATAQQVVAIPTAEPIVAVLAEDQVGDGAGAGDTRQGVIAVAAGTYRNRDHTGFLPVADGDGHGR